MDNMKIAKCIIDKLNIDYSDYTSSLKEDSKLLLAKHVLEFFKLYPEILEEFNPENMTREQIIEFIGLAIRDILRKRRIDYSKYECLQHVCWRYRSQETVLLLLFLGFKFNKAIERVKNNQNNECFSPSAGGEVESKLFYPILPREESRKYAEFIEALVDPTSTNKRVEFKYSSLIGDVIPKDKYNKPTR